MTRDHPTQVTPNQQRELVHDDERVGPVDEVEAAAIGEWLGLPWVEDVIDAASLSPEMVEHLLASAPDVSLRSDAPARFRAAWQRGRARGQVRARAAKQSALLTSPGQVLAVARQESDQTPATVASLLGVSEAAYTALERDAKKLWEVLSPEQLLRLARILFTSVDQLVESLRFAAATLMLRSAHDRFAGGLPRLDLARGRQATPKSPTDDLAGRMLRKENDAAGAFFAAVDKLRAHSAR